VGGGRFRGGEGRPRRHRMKKVNYSSDECGGQKIRKRNDVYLGK